MSRCELYRLSGMSTYNPNYFLIRIRPAVNTDAFSSIANAMQQRRDHVRYSGQSAPWSGWPVPPRFRVVRLIREAEVLYRVRNDEGEVGGREADADCLTPATHGRLYQPGDMHHEIGP